MKYIILSVIAFSIFTYVQAQELSIEFKAVETAAIGNQQNLNINPSSFRLCKTQINFYATKTITIKMEYQDSSKPIINIFKWGKKEKITDLKSGAYYIQYSSFSNGNIVATLDVYRKLSNNKIIGALFFNNIRADVS